VHRFDIEGICLSCQQKRDSKLKKGLRAPKA
jgi:hypothetical protein